MTSQWADRERAINEHLMRALHAEIVARGFNITTAAKAAGVTQQQLSGWLRSAHRMPAYRFSTIADAIGADAGQIFSNGTRALRRAESERRANNSRLAATSVPHHRNGPGVTPAVALGISSMTSLAGNASPSI